MKLFGTKIPVHKKSKVHARVKIAITLAVFLVVAFCIIAAARAQNTFIITDGDSSVTLSIYGDDVDEAIEKAGLSLSENDTYTSESDGTSTSVQIIRGKTVSINNGETTRIITTQAETVGDVLDDTGTELGKYDEINYTMDAPIEDGMEIVITPVEISYTDVDVALEFDTEYIANASMYEGQSKTITEGSEGLKTVTYECISINGVKEQFDIYSEDIVTEPVNAVIEYGTKVKETPAVTASPSSGSSSSSSSSNKNSSSSSSNKTSSSSSSSSNKNSSSSSNKNSSSSSNKNSSSSSSSNKNSSSSSSSSSSGLHSGTVTASGGTIITPSGETLTYSKVITCRTSAYSTELISNKLTALGTVASVGSIAVDPSVIPYNSKLYIVGTDGTWYYGHGVANDCGGAIKGNSIDVFFNTEAECQKFGIKYAYVYILS